MSNKRPFNFIDDSADVAKSKRLHVDDGEDLNSYEMNDDDMDFIDDGDIVADRSMYNIVDNHTEQDIDVANNVGGDEEVVKPINEDDSHDDINLETPEDYKNFCFSERISAENTRMCDLDDIEQVLEVLHAMWEVDAKTELVEVFKTNLEYFGDTLNDMQESYQKYSTIWSLLKQRFQTLVKTQ